jgi:hypothetical protein
LFGIETWTFILKSLTVSFSLSILLFSSVVLFSLDKLEIILYTDEYFLSIKELASIKKSFIF